jgi:hypothetical protein
MFFSSTSIERWTNNYNYWTSGTQKGCIGQWSWCDVGVGSVLDENLIWEKGQPDNKWGGEDCIHMKIATSNGAITFTDRNCSNLLIYACEVRTFRASMRDFLWYVFAKYLGKTP